MAKLKDAESSGPGKILLVPPSAFADTWPEKPDSPVAFGLRLLSERDKRAVRKMAVNRAKEAAAKESDPMDAYNDALVRLYVARGVCDVNDLGKPPELLRMADEAVFFSLTEGGAQFIFDALLAYEVESLPTHPPAEPEQVLELLQFLTDEDEPILLLPDESRETLLRHLRFCVDIIHENDAEDSPTVQPEDVSALLALGQELSDVEAGLPLHQAYLDQQSTR